MSRIQDVQLANHKLWVSLFKLKINTSGVYSILMYFAWKPLYVNQLKNWSGPEMPSKGTPTAILCKTPIFTVQYNYENWDAMHTYMIQQGLL